MAVALAFDETGSGPPLVILHGLFGSARNWRSFARRLAPRRRVFAVDLRNHGASPWAEPMTYAETVDDLGAFLDARRLGSAALLGHSLGGKTAMLYALLHPDRVERLIVVDIAPVRYVRDHRAVADALLRSGAETCRSRAEAGARLAGAVADAELRAFLLDNLVSANGGYSWRLNLRAIADAMDQLLGFPASADLGFRGPALFVSGRRSDYVGERHHGAIRGFFPEARFAVIEAAGHRVHADQPERFLAVVEEFLGEFPATAAAGRQGGPRE
jgi:pimeloyl-ACP methyl ester carboxylesterase